MQHGQVVPIDWFTIMFQSSSSQKAGCNLVQLHCGCCSTGPCFNPHPARRPDATWTLARRILPSLTGFNPHPARRPDATVLGGVGVGRQAGRVSILIQPEGRMQLPSNKGSAAHRQRVSILIQPEGRMQLSDVVDESQFYWLFQSSSSQKAGCNYSQQTYSNWAISVSILIQPEGRMQRRMRPSFRHVRMGFNPHPARRPDATPPPGTRQPANTCFNPHPARRPDATRAGREKVRPRRVSILIQPEGRMQLAAVLAEQAKGARFQSSSSQKAGCNTPCR